MSEHRNGGRVWLAVGAALLLSGAACVTNEYPIVEIELTECGAPEDGWMPGITYILTGDIVANPAGRRACFEPTVSAIRFDGRGHELRATLDPTGGREGIAIRVRGETRVSIENLSISNFRTGIDIGGSEDLVIISGNTFSNNFEAISVFNSHGVRIEAENAFHGAEAPSVYGTGVRVFDVNDVSVTDNSFVGLEQGLDIADSTETSITTNTFTDDARSITIRGGMAHEVTGNRLERAGGILLDEVMSNSTVVSNEIESARSGPDSVAAIRVNDSRDVDVRDNRISSNEVAGIVLWGTTDSQVAGNEVHDNVGGRGPVPGISLVDADIVSVTENVLSGNDSGIVGRRAEPVAQRGA